jgi:hypothetical protein
VSISEPIDFDTPFGTVTLTQIASLGQYHVDNLAPEVEKGLRERFEQGKWIGLLPYGYRAERQYDANGERIKGTDRAVFSDDAETARLIFTLYATDTYSDTELAAELNTRGLTMACRGKRVPFQKDSIGGILTDRFYLGYVSYHGQERPDGHEPLIEQDLWEQVQAIRDRRTYYRPTARRRAGGGRLCSAESSGLLLKIGYCARCAPCCIGTTAKTIGVVTGASSGKTLATHRWCWRHKSNRSRSMWCAPCRFRP